MYYSVLRPSLWYTSFNIALKMIHLTYTHINFYTTILWAFIRSNEHDMNLSKKNSTFKSFSHHIIQTDPCKKFHIWTDSIKYWCYSNRFMHQSIYQKECGFKCLWRQSNVIFYYSNACAFKFILISLSFTQIYIITSAI